MPEWLAAAVRSVCFEDAAEVGVALAAVTGVGHAGDLLTAIWIARSTCSSSVGM
ncbi:hypothetical protein [Streptosporangium sp. NPDC051022]|uniref:hypothetical protein n=1 Tax=Streptosporangium sp. NPDC051022 TaxID=3155752 RepID=UPI00342BC30E